MDDSQRMTLTAARYQSRVSVVTLPFGKVVKVVDANPQRLYLRFLPGPTNSTFPLMVPGPSQPWLSTIVGNQTDVEYKYKDCPAITTGEFYSFSGAGSTVTVIEDTYIGD